ncbi:hypothetical protein V6N11_080176 [Hibiscus sabdariffa]|uniref:Uncharacterized protein n=1 Tax=Hibiscus sabdariffa TaxID=183260 RepID=A0ABR1ZXR3_9ROSI
MSSHCCMITVRKFASLDSLLLTSISKPDFPDETTKASYTVSQPLKNHSESLDSSSVFLLISSTSTCLRGTTRAEMTTNLGPSFNKEPILSGGGGSKDIILSWTYKPEDQQVQGKKGSSFCRKETEMEILGSS